MNARTSLKTGKITSGEHKNLKCIYGYKFKREFDPDSATDFGNDEPIKDDDDKVVRY